MRRPLISAALAATLAFSVTACAGATGTKDAAPSTAASATVVRETATPTAAPALDLASFVADRSRAFTESGSYEFAVSTTIEGKTTKTSGSIVGTTPDDTSMSVTTELSTGETVTVIMVDGHAYVDGGIGGMPGKWADLSTSTKPSSTGLADKLKGSVDPTTMLAKLAKSTGTIVRGETSTIDGTKVTAYTVTMDVAQMLAALDQPALADGALEAGGSDGLVHNVFYVDDKGREVKVVTQLGTGLDQVGTYGGYGTQPPVTAPAADTIIDASEIGM